MASKVVLDNATYNHASNLYYEDIHGLPSTENDEGPTFPTESEDDTDDASLHSVPSTTAADEMQDIHAGHAHNEDGTMAVDDGSTLYTQGQVSDMMEKYQNDVPTLQSPLVGDDVGSTVTVKPSNIVHRDPDIADTRTGAVADAAFALQAVVSGDEWSDDHSPRLETKTNPVSEEQHRKTSTVTLPTCPSGLDSEGVPFLKYERPDDGGFSLLKEDAELFSNAIASGQVLSLENQAYYAGLQLHLNARRGMRSTRLRTKSEDRTGRNSKWAEPTGAPKNIFIGARRPQVPLIRVNKTFERQSSKSFTPSASSNKKVQRPGTTKKTAAAEGNGGRRSARGVAATRASRGKKLEMLNEKGKAVKM